MVHTAWSQTGVAPSQTSTFFDDLRKRSELFRSGAVDESSLPGAAAAGVYDFSRGEYTGESVAGRPMGERALIGDEAARAIGSQDYRSGFVGHSKRSAGDYTGASSSPYPTSSSYFAPTYITDPFLAGKRNIKLGPMNIGLGMNGNIEYNDNITQSHEDQLDDIIAGVYLNVDANWQFTQRNRLSFTATMGVDHYFDHPEESPRGKEYSFNIFPGTTLSFDFEIGEFHFVVYDRVSIRPESQSEFALDDLDVFGVFQNDIGLAFNWAMNSKTTLSLNYNHSSSQALEDDFAQTDRIIDSLSGSLAYTPSGTYTIGLETSISVVNYDAEFNNDGTTFSGGVFFASPITTNTLVKASFGYQLFEFDDPPPFPQSTVTQTDIDNTSAQITQLEDANADLDPVIDAAQIAANKKKIADLQDQQADQETKLVDETTAQQSRSFDTNTEFDDYYYNITLFNQLNARISHQLSFGHEASLNTASNFTTADYASYGIGIIAWQGARLSVSTYYENAEDSGGRLAETAEQWGMDALITHRLTPRLTLGVGYHYGNTDSATVGRDYEQQSYSVDFSYSLSQKMNVGFGYRYLNTDAEADQQSFDQNRFTLSMNYNF
jgi:hypothetical protein